MNLLFDENLSRRLIRRLEAAYPQSATLVSKDNDFRQLSFLRGHPPSLFVLDLPMQVRG